MFSQFYCVCEVCVGLCACIWVILLNDKINLFIILLVLFSVGKGGEKTTTLCAMFELLCPVTQSDLSHLSWLCHSVCLSGQTWTKPDKKHDFGKSRINQVQFSFFLVCVCVCVFPFTLVIWLMFRLAWIKNVLKWVSALISAMPLIGLSVSQAMEKLQCCNSNG